MRSRFWRSLGLFAIAMCAALSIGCGGKGIGSGASVPTALQVEQVISSARQQSGAPAMAAAVITSDHIVTSAVGLRKLGEPATVTTKDLFHLGSDVKSMTAMLVAHEVETGHLQWDTTIAQAFPEFAASMQPAFQNVTVKNLLSHRGGIPAFVDGSELELVPPLSGSEVEQRYQFTNWVLQQEPVGIPGQDYTYSNAGYVIAAAMVEKATGQTYETLMRKFLFTPMKMNAKFNWPGYQDPNQPWGYFSQDGSLVPFDPNDPANEFPAALNPAGNVSLSVEDFARYAQLHLRGLRGDAKLLKASTYTLLHTPVGEYALGWAIGKDKTGTTLSAHEGSAEMFDAWIIVQPEKDRAVVVLTNGMSEDIMNGNGTAALQLLEMIQ